MSFHIFLCRALPAFLLLLAFAGNIAMFIILIRFEIEERRQDEHERHCNDNQ